MRPVERVAAAFARARGLPSEVEEHLVALLRREREDALAALVPASQLADFRAMGAPGTGTPPPTDAPAGDARYEPLIPLGTGGMGEVWRVRDRALDRTVAMKILKAELTPNPAAVQQFEAEVRLTARLQHPNILPVYDVGQRADGRAWYTMREASGRTLDALRVADAPRPPAELRRLVGALRQACAACPRASSGPPR